jgi:hypothetical protein
MLPKNASNFRTPPSLQNNPMGTLIGLSYKLLVFMVPDIKKDSKSCDQGIQCTTRIKVPKGSKTLFSTATYRLALGPTQ